MALGRTFGVDVLGRLESRSLLIVEDHDGTAVRYRLLESIRAFALQAMADAARHYDLIGGSFDVRPLNDDAIRSWHQPWPRDRLRSLVLPCAAGGNFAIWADVLSDLGGWSSDYEAGGEDSELSWRAQLAGYRLGFVPDAIVYVRYRSGIWETARQAYANGIHCEQILREEEDMARWLESRLPMVVQQYLGTEVAAGSPGGATRF